MCHRPEDTGAGQPCSCCSTEALINDCEARASPEQQGRQHCDDCPHVSHGEHDFPRPRGCGYGHLHSVQCIRCIRVLLRPASALLAAHSRLLRSPPRRFRFTLLLVRLILQRAVTVGDSGCHLDIGKPA